SARAFHADAGSLRNCGGNRRPTCALQPPAAEYKCCLTGTGRGTDRELAAKECQRLLPSPFSPFLFHLGPKNSSSVSRPRVEEEDARQQLEPVGNEMHRAQPARTRGSGGGTPQPDGGGGGYVASDRHEALAHVG